MEIKALHCSDIHLDSRYSHIRGKGSIKREEQRDIFKRICQIAKDEKVDIFLIAGDLFESARFNIDTIRFVRDQISQLSPMPVFIAPGNEDPFTDDSPYSLPGWPPNAVIFNTNRFRIEEIPEKKIIIYGAAHKTSDDRSQVMKSFRIKKKEGIHIALFHGTDTANKSENKSTCFPFTSEEIKASTVNYAALGHIHHKRGIPEEKSVAYYCGAPEYMNFDETGERGVILARISTCVNEITFIPTWKRKFLSKTIACDEYRNTAQLIEHLKRLSEDDAIKAGFTKIILTGYTSAEYNTEEIEDQLKDSFYHFSVENRTLPHFDLDRLREEKSTRGRFVSLVKDKISREPDKEKDYTQALYRGLEAFTSRKVDMV